MKLVCTQSVYLIYEVFHCHCQMPGGTPRQVGPWRLAAAIGWGVAPPAFARSGGWRGGGQLVPTQLYWTPVVLFISYTGYLKLFTQQSEAVDG